MKHEWRVRLEGGPHDGESAIVRWQEPPPKMWVTLCPRCKDTHWFDRRESGAEVYSLDEQDRDERTAKYVQGDLDLDPDGSIHEQELAPA